MTKISNTTSETIEFSVSSTRKLIIEPGIPVEVTSAELAVLQDRLGSQIEVVSSVEETPTEESVQTETTEEVVAEIVEETPVAETEVVQETEETPVEVVEESTEVAEETTEEVVA